MIIRILLLLSITLLTGCIGASSINDMKSNPSKVLSFEVDENYQRVHKRISNGMYTCLGEVNIDFTSSYTIRNEIYSELRESSLSYIFVYFGAQNYTIHVDISSIENNKTHIDTYSYLSTSDSTLDDVKKWALNKNQECN